MQLFQLRPSREVGVLKNLIKDAILDGKIPNDYASAKQLLIEEAQKLGLTTQEN